MKYTLSIILFFCAASGYAQSHDTIHLYFPLDKTQLTERSTKIIDSLISNNWMEHDKRIAVLGYADYLGSDDYDKAISAARAKNVEDYLVILGIDKKNITRCVGKGKINRTATGKKGNVEDRKVDIIFDARIDTPEDKKFRYYLTNLKVDETLPLKNIEFYRGSLRITPESLPWLKIASDVLLENKNIIFRLEGHVCCIGPILGIDEHYDEGTLSQKRAQEIADSFVARGVDTSRIKGAIGMGNGYPIAWPEVSAQDQQANRRVEIRIINK